MEISNDKLIELFENVRSTKERLESVADKLADVIDRLERGQQHLQRQIDANRKLAEDRLAKLELRAAGERRFLRGVWVGASLVCGAIGSAITLLCHWIGTR